MATYSRMFEGTEIAGIQLRNKLVMSPMTTNYATAEGMVTDRLCDYYVARAKGGVGLVVAEGAVVQPVGKGFAYALGNWDDAHIPGLTRLAKEIKAEGAGTILQLIHCGRQTNSAIAGSQPVAPSPIACPRMGEVPKELSITEIKEVEQAFSLAAVRAKKAGFHGIELHGGTGYLLTQFLSPKANQRTDAYGGSLENRARIVLEMIELIRSSAGKDYPIFYRLCADEFLDGGTSLDESKATARMLEKAGVVAIDVVGGTYSSTRSPSGSTGTPKPFFVYMAKAIKEVVTVPVMNGGGIYDPAVAEGILEAGNADLIVLGRGVLSDPEFPAKAREGRADEILPCFRCLTCTPGPVVPDSRCPVNPALGNEKEFAITLASRPKKLLVVGSGVPASEAARRAALRGHQVTVMEEGSQVGGMLGLRAHIPRLGEIEHANGYFTRALSKLGIAITMGAATPEAVRKGGYDAVLVASAGPAKKAEGAGLEGALQGRDIIEGTVRLGDSNRGVAVIGTGLFGGETALFVASQGKQVVLVDPAADIAPAVAPATRGFLLAGLNSQGVEIRTASEARSFIGGTLKVVKNGAEEEIKDIGQVVLALGFCGPDGLADSLRAGGVKEVFSVADVYEPLPATAAAYQAAKIVNSL